jgi:hypothetical protein
MLVGTLDASEIGALAWASAGDKEAGARRLRPRGPRSEANEANRRNKADA